jgi:alpha-ketoglutarate-dependent taurine dioxygenase
MLNESQALARRFLQLGIDDRRRFIEKLRASELAFAELPIVPAPRSNVLPLSHAQSRQWFLWRLDERNTAYHICAGLRLQGRLVWEALVAAFTALVARHESLRTVFRGADDGVGEQIIQPPEPVDVPLLDLSAVTEASRAAATAEAAGNIAHAPFDLTVGPLFRAGVIRVSAEEHILVVAMHHIVSDGWSMEIIVNDFTELYRAKLENRAARLEALPVQYADYAVWQRNWLAAGEQEQQLQYWRNVLGSEHPPLPLPTDYPRAATLQYRAAHHSFDLPESLIASLRERARQHDATLFMVLLTGFQALLYRYTNHSDIRVGRANANRNRPEVQGVVGFFVNTQVLRSEIHARMTLQSLLEHVRAAEMGAQEHLDLPFEQLVEALSPRRSLNHPPLFQVMMNHQRRNVPLLPQLPGLALQIYALGEQQAQLDLTLSTTEHADGSVKASLTYARELFDPQTIARLAQHYVRVLHALAGDLQQTIGDALDEIAAEAQRAKMAELKTRRRAQVRQIPRARRQRITTLAEFRPLLDDTALPLVCTPSVDGLSLSQWAKNHRDDIQNRLQRHGAILFRGFVVNDAAEFNACIDAIGGTALEYRLRSSPRTQVDAALHVYTSTDYPASEKIFPHNESSYAPEFPLQLFFYCHTPATARGETPIGDTRQVLERIDAEVRECFQRRQVMYVRNFGDGLGLAWQDVFQTTSAKEVEQYCAAVGSTVEWLPGERLRIRSVGPAIVKHPGTGELSWFNHATFFNALTFPPSIRGTLLSRYAPDELPQNTFYGDGAPIEPEVIRHLQAAYRDAMVEFPWKTHDVLLLDNLITAHARNEFIGPRRILVGMAGTGRAIDLQHRERGNA